MREIREDSNLSVEERADMEKIRKILTIALIDDRSSERQLTDNRTYHLNFFPIFQNSFIYISGAARVAGEWTTIRYFYFNPRSLRN